jgi:hypothetical protein
MRTITLNPKQQRDAAVLSRLEAGALDPSTTAELLGVRQLGRRARFRAEGMAAVIHVNCGRSPANRTAPEVVGRILELAAADGVQNSEKIDMREGWFTRKGPQEGASSCGSPRIRTEDQPVMSRPL